MARTRNRWVLSIDADEELTPELRAAILALGDEPPCAAYAVNRMSRFLGRWIRHCGWHPEWVVRLFDKERARFDDEFAARHAIWAQKFREVGPTTPLLRSAFQAFAAETLLDPEQKDIVAFARDRSASAEVIEWLRKTV